LACENGTETAGKIVKALRPIMGFAKVFDISFTTDKTIVEEANKFLKQLERNQRCVPVYIMLSFVNRKCYLDFISNLSSYRSLLAKKLCLKFRKEI
jgi:iron only hydrogenase large subunit-like protein